MMKRVSVGAVLWMLILAPTAARAQPSGWTERFLVSASGAFQGTRTDFRDAITFTEFVEEGRIDTGYEVESGPALDGLAAVRLFGNFGVGVGVSYFTRRDAAALEARVPHPFFFDRHRSVSSGIPGARRTEIAAHLQAVFLQPLTSAFDLLLSGGPSLVTVEQTLVSRIEYAHTFPFDEATFQSAGTRRDRQRGVGVNVGADLTWRGWRHVGIGGGVRFIDAQVDLRSEGHDVEVDAGGLQGTVGLRLRF